MPSDQNPLSLTDQNEAHAASSQAIGPTDSDSSNSGADETPAPDGTAVVPSPS